ncbi:MAG: hypothetical protein LBS96_08670 [Oscillospiraceae bacterium]|jgi:hypothetical protein|nr:hypothetical protein [Oscillospiraceae bacterium]
MKLKRLFSVLLAMAFAMVLVTGCASSGEGKDPVATDPLAPQQVLQTLQKYLPAKVLENLPNFRQEAYDNGGSWLTDKGTLYLWSKWSDEEPPETTTAHKIEFLIAEETGELAKYRYKSYDFVLDENSITMAQAQALVQAFATDFIPQAAELNFKNKPLDSNNLYDPGTHEGWVSVRGNTEYMIMIDLVHGLVESFEAEFLAE